MSRVAPETPRKTTRQAADNYRFVYDNNEEYLERQGRQPQTTSCLFCGEAHIGTVAEGRVWAAEHRARLHPDAKDRGQRARQRAAKEGRGQRW